MGKIIELYIKEKDDELIENEKLFNVYVFGLPRSGTSMATHILELLGVNMVYTSEENKKRTAERYEKQYGDYHPNRKGFFEITNNFFESYLKILSTPYAGCKMIIPVHHFRWEIVKNYPSKVIMMLRDPEEIRQSQMAFYRNDNIDTDSIKSLLATEKVKLKENNIDFITVDYRDVLENREIEIQRIADFIKSDIDITDAVNFVDIKENRFRKEVLINGI